MPQLDVPLFKQPPNTGECGIACLAMIHGYYKTGVTYDQIRQNLPLVFYADEAIPSLSMMALGEYLQGQGFQTKIITANPRLFCAADLGAKPEDVQKILTAHSETLENGRERKIYAEFDSYFNAGGQIEVGIPAIHHIQAEIDAKAPLIAAGTSKFMHNQDRVMDLHFTVVTGYDDKQIYVNDPNHFTGGKHALPHNLWFYSLIATTHADVDCGALLSIRPKTKGQTHDQHLHP